MQSSKLGCQNGILLEGKGLDLGAEPSHTKIFWVPPPPGGV